MKKNFPFVFLFILPLLSILAQEKDFSQKQSSFNNSKTTYGPILQSPLSALSESFEGTTFPPSGWTKVNPDGGTGWDRINAGITPVPGFQGGLIWMPNSEFGNAVAYCTWTTGGENSNDQWLFTPQINNVQPNDSLSFWLWKYGNFTDQINVKISTSNATPSEMNISAASIDFGKADSGWVQYKINIGDLVPAGSNIYIGFEEAVVDNLNEGAFIVLDLIKVNSRDVPVELINFSATCKNDRVLFAWSTATEKNNRGFEIQKMVHEQFVYIDFVNGKGTTTEVSNYYISDKSLPGKYLYRLKQIDFNGNSSYSKPIEVRIAAPAEFELSQNYPNPFNPVTKIDFALPFESRVNIQVYNLIGQKVADLISEDMSAGVHSVDFNASNLASGIYLYKLIANGSDGSIFISAKKMILNK